jgi:hypothetical protein
LSQISNKREIAHHAGANIEDAFFVQQADFREGRGDRRLGASDGVWLAACESSLGRIGVKGRNAVCIQRWKSERPS